MMIKPGFFLAVFMLITYAFAQQSTPYLLTQFPKAAKDAHDPDTVAWTGIARPLPGISAPDSGFVYFDRSPGGSKIDNYRYKVEKFFIDTQSNGSMIVQDNIYLPGKVPQRKIVFRPVDQKNMGYGLFYYIVGFKTKILGKDTTFVSNELELIVESPNPVIAKSPLDSISELTPVFQWETNPGVPYYHVILSDEALSIDTVNGKMNISGLSISWQAITPFTQITYGTPDPSGTLTSTPPPLSPGKTYFWAVLNNYKNNILYTSSKVGLPLSFTIKGLPMVKAKNISPKNVVLTSGVDSVVTFKWTHLDPRANTYRVYLYIASDIQQVDAKMIAWSGEVTAGTFVGANGVLDTTDTGSLTINARSILSKNKYTWKAFAIDNKGASMAGDTSTFQYTDPATGQLLLYTREKIISTVITETGTYKDTALSPVTMVQMQVDVVNGSQEAPLLFYTDLDGNLNRQRPSGTYRISAQKSGFEPLTKTIRLDSGAVIIDTFYLKRPDATIFGKVVDKTEIGINVATVFAVSDRNDTVGAQTDVLGSFIVNCSEGNWRIFAQKTGYVTSIPKQVQVTFGQSVSFGNIMLTMNPFSVSAKVTNEKSEPILGANVKIVREGIVVDEIPSTPQNGTVSFSLSSGTYSIIASKIGFESFSKELEVSNSMQLSVVMASGAALIKGSVIGATWIDGKRIFAPITKASIIFVDTTVMPGKTFTAISDATYGDYGVSVSGNRRFKSIASANGFITKTETMSDSTKSGTTLLYNDTLQSLGMVTGMVTISGEKTVVDNATVSLLNSTTNKIIASAISQGNGYFEVRDIPDGIYYVKAGAQGFFMDSVRAGDTIYASSGKTTIQGASDGARLTVYMSPGKKTVTWVVSNGADSTATISIQSPLQKIIRYGQSLTNAGHGDYIVSVNGIAPSIIDLAYHQFTVLPAESLHIDSVDLPVSNTTEDSLSIDRDSVRLTLTSTKTLDSAVVYYRDVTTPGFLSIARKDSGSTFSFAVRPLKDGSMFNYYFTAYRGKDIYGYSSETFFSYVKPDTTRLSKLEIIPGSSDTSLIGAKSEIRVSFQGYFGSTFIPASIRDSSALIWKLIDAPNGTVFLDSIGSGVAFITGSDSSKIPMKLMLTIDTSKQKTMPGVTGKTLYYTVTDKPMTSLRIRRIDAGSQNPITTSELSKAEFIAEGMDASGRALLVSPTWSFSPSRAGTLNTFGVFSPKKNFAGKVRVYGQANGLSGEYNADGSNELLFGLEVKHQILASAQPDTVSNLRGCMVVLPDSIVSNEKSGLLQISMPLLQNRLEQISGAFTVTGSSFEIKEETGVNFQLKGEDSIHLVLAIPEASIKNTTGEKRTFCIGYWNKDSLHWTMLTNSQVDLDAKTVSANISHFSRYAVLVQTTSFTSTLSILPNPFSPDKRASDYPSLLSRLGTNSPKGTCISFTPEVSDATIQQIRIAIYNIVGEQVAKVIMENGSKIVEHHLWWDGRSTGRGTATWDLLKKCSQDENGRIMEGQAMCRNGRYFVVLTIRDDSGKEKNFMKQVILIK
jgi:hypothetical protein